MENTGYRPVLVQEPMIETESEAFAMNFQKAILLSLLENHQLTQVQFESCVEKVVQKHRPGTPPDFAKKG